MNAATVNYRTLVGNGRVFLVPPFQRDYSWRDEQWEDLWSDILGLVGRPAEQHYLGAVVLTNAGGREYRVIDGQQRLATLMVLTLAVIDRLQQLADQGIEAQTNRERAAELRRNFVGQKDPASLREVGKLRLNRSDDAFFRQCLVNLEAPRNERSLTDSNRLLWECLQYFRRCLAAEPSLADDGFALASLVSAVIADQVLVIQITASDDVNAYTVFETLNARGTELTATDLLKNYLFSRVSTPSDMEDLQEQWQELVDIVQQRQLPTFLRYHMLCENPHVRSQQLFKLVREQVAEPAAVFQLTTDLLRRADLFAALSEPGSSFWLDYPGASRPVAELCLFGVQQPTPLLFAAAERLAGHEFVKVLRMVSDLTFRYTVVGRLNPSELERVYHHAAKAALSDRRTSPARIAAALREVAVPDARFRQDFAQLSLAGRKLGLKRYILAKLQSHLSGTELNPETAPVTVEHVLPRNPGPGWEQAFPGQVQRELVERVGNLALLSRAANHQLANADYAAKLPAYEASEYALTRAIPEMAPEEWTPAYLEERQRRLADLAVLAWRVDFPEE
ncbi:MAG: DUF262 domain-containing protein [Fimbriimonadaceae bacterium]|nr:DUF262 domain-containing protein [Fimbriimonadaceae bacterium]